MLKVFHQLFKLCFVGGDAAGIVWATGAGCGCANGSCALPGAGASVVILNASFPICQSPVWCLYGFPAEGESRWPDRPGQGARLPRLGVWGLDLGFEAYRRKEFETFSESFPRSTIQLSTRHDFLSSARRLPESCELKAGDRWAQRTRRDRGV